MTKEEAHNLLDEHKNGIRIHPVVEVTKALWVTGDLRGLPRKPEPSDEDGIDTGVERIRLVSSKGA